LHKYTGRSDTPSRRKPIEEEFVKAFNETYKIKLKQNRSSDWRFSNCSFVIWNGVPISCYRKTTYREEVEEPEGKIDIVRQGYGYDFGNWKSYPTPELSHASDDHKKFARLFNTGRKQIIASRICSDLSHMQTLSKSIKLLIVQADSSPEIPGWKAMICNANVCVSDADRGCFMVISGTITFAKQIQVSPFIKDKLSCIVTVYYGDEIVEVGCCG
jgi:hypothetical protein